MLHEGPPGEVTDIKSELDTDSEWPTKVLKDAKQVWLGVMPACPASETLIEVVLQRCSELAAPTRKTKRRAKGMQKLRRAIGAIVGNVLMGWLQNPPQAVYQSHHPAAFTGELVGIHGYRDAEDAMIALGLLERSRSVAYARREGFGHERRAARIRPSPSLLALAEEHAVTTDNIAEAFHIQHPPGAVEVAENDLVVVRELQSYQAKQGGSTPIRLTAIEQSDAFNWIKTDVAEMNEEGARHTYAGCRTPSWARVFYRSQMLYGRWHAKRGSYQLLSKADRAAITIDGQAVVELDIQASHLTILAALAEAKLPDGDPYEVPGIPRQVVKQWVVITLGKGSVPSRWPTKATDDDPELSKWQVPSVTKAVLAHLPFLANPMAPKIAVAAKLPHLGAEKGRPNLLSLRLMAIEAEAMTFALQRLRGEGIIALPVHDSLIVPSQFSARAKAVLGDACEYAYGGVPTITGGVTARHFDAEFS